MQKLSARHAAAPAAAAAGNLKVVSGATLGGQK
jgi:hypothetical protein